MLDDFFIYKKLPNLGTNSNSGLYLHKWQARKFQMSYLKQSSSIDKALTTWFIRPNFISRGGNKTFFLSKSGWWTIFDSLVCRSGLGSQLDWTQYLSQSLLSHIYKRQIYFVYPCKWPKRKQTNVRSTLLINLYTWNCNRSINNSKKWTTELNNLPGMNQINFHYEWEHTSSSALSFEIWACVIS